MSIGHRIICLLGALLMALPAAAQAEDKPTEMAGGVVFGVWGPTARR